MPCSKRRASVVIEFGDLGLERDRAAVAHHLDVEILGDLIAAEQVPRIGFGRYLLSATTPFAPEHLPRLRSDAPDVVRDLFPDYEEEYGRRGWTMASGFDRVYVNQRAREELGWRPRFDFRRVLDSLHADEDVFSPLARAVGSKGYHSRSFDDGPYPLESRV